MGPEKTFENRIKKYLDSLNIYYVKYFANGYTKSGVPDILASVNGVFVGIEVKAENGKPSKLQLHHRDRIRKAGGISVVVYPKDFEKFKLFINFLLSNSH